MPTYTELREEIAAKSRSLAEIFEQAGSDLDLSKVTVIEGDVAAKAAEIRRRNDELTDLGKQRDEMRAIEEIGKANAAAHATNQRPANGMVHPAQGDTKSINPPQREPEREQKTIGEMFTDSDAYKQAFDRTKMVVALGDVVNIKTLMTTSAGWSQAPVRIPRVVLSAQRRPVVADLIPQDPTEASVIRFMEETTFTNNAAMVAEGATKPESALAFTERTQLVEVLAHTLPVTRQQLDDIPGIQGVINNRLTLMIELAEETELISGSGVTPHLMGFLNKPSIQSQAKGADPSPDAVMKAMVKVQFTGFADPSGIVFNPTDWMNIKLLRETTGGYIWGHPSEVGPERIWGMPIVKTPAMTLGTALTGDFQLYSHISRKMGLQFDTSDQHSTFFVENKIMLRLEERLSLEIYRAAAFCLVTGL